MIPVKLELYNFLAYRQPEPIDLSGLHVACLAGENGAGKSSILDAITWVLWGRARAKRDEELIHLGETEMQVGLTFRLSDVLYRVIRQRSTRGRGSSTLELSVLAEEGRWRTLSEATLRATQDKINRTLKLDYETFINSAFLVQGRADEFTNKTPAERKRILAEILGLDIWSEYEETTKDKVKHIEQFVATKDAQIAEIDVELQHELDYHRELQETQQTLNEVLVQEQEMQAKVRVLEEAHHQRAAQRIRFEDFLHRLAGSQEELNRTQADLVALDIRRQDLLDLIDAAEEIETGYAALSEARGHAQHQSDLLLAQSDLKDRQSYLTALISKAQAELEARRRELQGRCQDLQGRLVEVVTSEALAGSRERLSRLEQMDLQKEEIRSALDTIRIKGAELRERNDALKKEMDAIVRQRDHLMEMTDPVCPTCGQILDEPTRAELIRRLNEDGTQRGDEWRANDHERKQIEQKEFELEQDRRELEPELRELPALRNYVAAQEEKFERALQDKLALERLSQGLAEVERLLGEQAYALEEQAELEIVESKLAILGYDAALHRTARDMVEIYDAFEGRKHALEKARDSIEEVETRRMLLTEQAQKWSQQIEQETQQLATLRTEVERLDAQLMDYAQVTDDLDRLHDEVANARHRVGSAEQKIKALETQRQRRVRLLEERGHLAEQRSIYEELRRAFSKDGVPAMVIEAAIPEIESEANQILSGMTAGQMHIQFDTQREKVTGGIKETLDIRIADALGARDYATFSGGEAFRVNFAIRLALSRLLARRAGTQLRTLIIDEGFGTQDAQGRERLVQAINAVQDDFDLILVITHIDELKELFPVRIEVTKTKNGSFIELV